jgi:prephenate dehydrogenase
MCQSSGVNIAVIGLGLIGGSTLRALAAAGHNVVGYDADPSTRALARAAAARVPREARWQVMSGVADAVDRAHVVIVAVPLPSVGIIFDLLANVGYQGLVTDVTSVKRAVRDLATQRLLSIASSTGYVGGHPMAGRELSGFTASDPELFRDCAWVLCLEPEETALDDWLDLAEIITALGARVVPSTAVEHDRAVAAISHVPHLVASAVATCAGGDPLALALAAGSFRDGTRVAATRAELVASMCGGNAAAVRPALDAVLIELGRIRAALESVDPISSLVPMLSPGQEIRQEWPATGSQSLGAVAAQPDVLLRLGRMGGWITGVSPDRRGVMAAMPATAAHHGRGE